MYWQGKERQGKAWHGMTMEMTWKWHGMPRKGMQWHGKEIHGMESEGNARHGVERKDMVWKVKEMQGMGSETKVKTSIIHKSEIFVQLFLLHAYVHSSRPLGSLLILMISINFSFSE
jgi:hypothetical protein